MSAEITNREHVYYIVGSYIIAIVGNVGVGLASDTRWKTIIGTTLITGLILYAMTVKHQHELRGKESR